MLKSTAFLLMLLLLSGCATAWTGVYDTEKCGLTKSQSKEIAADIIRDLGEPPTRTTDYQGRMDILIEFPAERPIGLNIVPNVRLTEPNERLFVGLDDNGDGTSQLSKKWRDSVQRALTRHGCSSWTFEEGRYDPNK